MKKLLSFLIALVTALSLSVLVSCAEDDNSDKGAVVIDGLTIENGVVTKYEPTSDSGIELVIPEKAGGVWVTEIYKDVFRDCKAIKTVSIPASMKKIGKNAFKNCSNLEGVYITDVAGWAGIEFDETFANPIASENCNKLYVNGELLEELKLPNYVTRIERYAFYMCLSLKKVTISTNITFIGKRAFSGVTSKLEQFVFEQPNNWSYDTGSGKGSSISSTALQRSRPIEGDRGWGCAISYYNQEGHYDWMRSE